MRLMNARCYRCKEPINVDTDHMEDGPLCKCGDVFAQGGKIMLTDTPILIDDGGTVKGANADKETGG